MPLIRDPEELGILLRKREPVELHVWQQEEPILIWPGEYSGKVLTELDDIEWDWPEGDTVDYAVRFDVGLL